MYLLFVICTYVYIDKFVCQINERYGTRRSKRRKLEIGENPEDGIGSIILYVFFRIISCASHIFNRPVHPTTSCTVILLYPMEENAQDVITMNRGDFKRLEPGEYLNDNIIDFKIKILMEELKVCPIFSQDGDKENNPGA